MQLKGLVVDWGGVLTGDVRSAVGSWARQGGIDPAAFGRVMGRWLGPEGTVAAQSNPIHALERGEMEVDHFEQRLAQALAEHMGTTIEAEGLMTRLFEEFESAHDMIGLVRRARQSGIRTALLSNSWGNSYPSDLWADMFDAIVISGEVGMRKPEERIYLHTLDLLGLRAEEVVFVDDFPHNVAAAVSLGMVGVHHVEYARTAAELEVLFGAELA